MTIGWINGGGAKRAVFVKQASSGTASPAYTASTTFAGGTRIGTSDWYCVYNGTGASVSVTGMSPSKDYIVHVCEYDCPTGYEKITSSDATDNPKVQQTNALTAPLTQAYNVTFSNGYATAITVSWTIGDGAKRAVFAKAASTGTASPSNNTNYSASAVFGSGTQIGTSGWYCVYNGTGTTVAISGLSGQTDYIFQAIEYNGDPVAELYATAVGGNNPMVQQTTLTQSPASGDGTSGNPYIISSIYNLNWIAQNPASWSLCFLQNENIDLTSTNTWNSGAGFDPMETRVINLLARMKEEILSSANCAFRAQIEIIREYFVYRIDQHDAHVDKRRRD